MESHSARALVIKDSRVLLLKVKENEKTYFVIPGGKKEGGERLEEALVREVLEETNIDIKVERKIEEISSSYDNIHKVHHLYLCKYISGKPKLNASPELEKMRRDSHFKCVPGFYEIPEVIDEKVSPNVMESQFKSHLRNSA